MILKIINILNSLIFDPHVIKNKIYSVSALAAVVLPVDNADDPGNVAFTVDFNVRQPVL